MRTWKLCVTFLLVCFTTITFAQPIFTKTYGITGLSSAYGLPGKGLLIAGTDYYTGAENMSLLKTDDNGTVQWSKSYGDGGSSFEIGLDAIQTLDGNYLLVGSNPYGNSFLYVVKTDTNGNMLWHKTYRGVSVSNINQDISDIEQLPDSGIVIAGTAGNYGMLMKIDSDGNILWTSNFLGTGTTTITKLLPMPGGDFLITGSDNNQFYIARVNSAGTLVWAKRYAAMGLTGENGCATSDGRYVFTGTTASAMTTMKIDQSGNVAWARSYNTGATYGCAVTELINRNLFFSFYANSSVTIMKTDTLGNAAVCKSEGIGNLQMGRNLRPSGDGSYVTISASTLLKVNGTPSICMPNNVTITPTTISPVPAGFGFTVNTYSSLVTQSFFSFSIPISCTVVCGGKCSTTDNFAVVMNFPDTVCKGTAVTMNSSFTIASSTPTYTWYENGIPFSTLSTPVRIFNNPGAYNIMMIAKNQSSCRDTTVKTIYVRGDCGTDGSPVPYFNRSYTNFTNPNDMLQTPDSGLVIAGKTTVGATSDMCIMKTDAGGNVLWGKTYGAPAVNEAANFVRLMPDKGFLIASDDNYVFVVRTDSVGNVLWENNYQATNPAGITSNILKDVVITPDSGAIFVGRNINNYGMIFKIDKNGNVVWARHKSTCYFTSACAMPNNEFLIGGSSPGVACIFKIDGAGNTIWGKNYTTPSFQDIYDILPLTDGGYAVTVKYTNSADIILMKIDANGNIIWTTLTNASVDGTNAGVVEDAGNGLNLVTHTPTSSSIILQKSSALGIAATHSYYSGSTLITPVVYGYDRSCYFMEGTTLHKFLAFQNVRQCINNTIPNTYTAVPPYAPVSINPATNTYCIALPQPYATNPSVHTVSTICSNAGCNASASFNASIFACLNQTVSFTNTSIGGTAYTWKVNNVLFASTTNASYTFTTTGTFAVKLKLTNSTTGCTDSMTVNIVVSAIPAVNYNQVVTTFCSTSPTVTLTAGTPSGGFYSGPGVFGNTFNPSLVGVGTYQIVYTGISSGGCPNSDTSVITVVAPPVVSYTQSQTTFCTNSGTVTLTPGSPAGGTYSGPGVTGTTFNPATAGPGIHTITYTYTSGCTNTATSQITVNAAPVVSYAQSPSSVCVASSAITLSAGSPAGGTYSGPGVTGNTFNPASVGVGTYTIVYTYTSGGCTNSASSQISVTAAPVVSYSQSPATFCTNSSVITLTAGTPAGGTYSGPGVTGNTFDPASAGVGTHTITYTYTSGGCTNTATSQVSVTTIPVVSFTQSPSTFCTNASAITLSPGSPAGGTYSGPGVTGTTFNPATAGAGTHTITYTYTSGGCTNTATSQITVTAAPVVSFTQSPSSVCVASSAITLSAGTPSGGTYSGPGITGNTFDPSVAGVGTHTIIYTYTSGGCTNSASSQIAVTAIPVVSYSQSPSTFCANSSVVTLTPGTPAGGTYSGPGVSGSTFDPASAGVGTHTITYTYTSGGCTNTATSQITVTTIPVVSFTQSPTIFCSNSTSITLSPGTPAGGIYSGPGVSGNSFDPSIAGAGTHTIIYSYTSAGCTNSDSEQISVNAAPVVNYVQTPANWCASSTVVTLSPATPAGGIYSGPGVSGNTFDPASVGIGNYAIVYTYTSGGCTNSDTEQVSVTTIPLVNYTQSPATFCATSPVVTLSAGIPSGGVYSGPGVTGNTFDPASVGVGTYSIVYTYTASGGCTNSASSQISVNAIPVVSYVQSPITFCDNSPVITLSPGAPAGGTYSGPGVSGNTFAPATVGVGSYAIIYSYTSAGCANSDTAQVSVTVCTGTTIPDLLSGTQIFPNPSSGIFTLSSGIANGEFEIYNVLGEIILADKITSTETTINLSAQSSGIYFITIRSESGSFTQKIVVNH